MTTITIDRREIMFNNKLIIVINIVHHNAIVATIDVKKLGTITGTVGTSYLVEIYIARKLCALN